MSVKTIEILGDNRFETYTKTRVGCRAVIVKDDKILLSHEEYRYTSHYFICEVTGEGHMNLTEAEIRRGLEPEWITLDEAIDIFSKHESYAETSEEKRGAFQREYLALKEYMEHIERMSKPV